MGFLHLILEPLTLVCVHTEFIHTIFCVLVDRIYRFVVYCAEKQQQQPQLNTKLRSELLLTTIDRCIFESSMAIELQIVLMVFPQGFAM